MFCCIKAAAPALIQPPPLHPSPAALKHYGPFQRFWHIFPTPVKYQLSRWRGPQNKSPKRGKAERQVPRCPFKCSSSSCLPLLLGRDELPERVHLRNTQELLQGLAADIPLLPLPHGTRCFLQSSSTSYSASSCTLEGSLGGGMLPQRVVLTERLSWCSLGCGSCSLNTPYVHKGMQAGKNSTS